MPITSQVVRQLAAKPTAQAARQAAKRTSQAATRVAGDELATRSATKVGRTVAAKAAAQAVMAPPVLTKKATQLLTGAGVTKLVASEALTAGDLVFQQAIKQGLKQTDALALASQRIAEKLGTAGVNTELVTALTNGLRPATRAQLGKSAAAGRVTRSVKKAAGKTKPVVNPVPGKPVPVAPQPPVATKPAPKAPPAAKPIAKTPPRPTGTPAPIRRAAEDLALLGTAAYEAGRLTRRAADATYRAGQATRAYVAEGGITRSWQGAWARHDQAYQTMQRELTETTQAAGQWVKQLATRVISG
ncbi:MAG: hypothetical protein VKP62_15395 [Candidatus Sericytochromatia bacterium]|nr:hypothetical protein [Candidatus Sericytochromatia bacterium]